MDTLDIFKNDTNILHMYVVVLSIEETYKNKPFKKPQKIHPHQTYPPIPPNKYNQNYTKIYKKQSKNIKKNTKEENVCILLLKKTNKMFNM